MVLICNSLMLRIISYHCWSFVCLSLLNVSSELLPDFNCVLVGVFCLFVVVDVVVVVWFWEVWVLFCCYCLFECLIWLGYYPLIRSCLASIFPHYLCHLFTLSLVSSTCQRLFSFIKSHLSIWGLFPMSRAFNQRLCPFQCIPVPFTKTTLHLYRNAAQVMGN